MISARPSTKRGKMGEGRQATPEIASRTIANWVIRMEILWLTGDWSVAH